MSDKQDVVLTHINDVMESKSYIETNADGVVTIGTQSDSYEIFNFVFLNSTPLLAMWMAKLLYLACSALRLHP